MEMQLVQTEAGLNDLRDEWESLTSRTEPGALFSSYDFVAATWRHLRRPGDHLFVLCARRHARLVAIAPFALNITRAHGVPLRYLRLIGAEEGDRAGIISELPEDEAWDAIVRYLLGTFTSWDILELAEQCETGAVVAPSWRLYREFGFHCRKELDNVSYAIPLCQSWPDYLGQRSKQVRKNWMNRRKRFEADFQGLRIECYDRPEDTRVAMARFVNLERSGWKGEAHVGVSRTPQHLAFYSSWFSRLSACGILQFLFLKAGQDDAAALILVRTKRKIISLQIVYHEKYATYSPATLLRLEAIRGYFSGEYDECDLLGMPPGHGPPRNKMDWATIERKAYRVVVVRQYGRALPILLASQLKRLFQRQKAGAAA